MPHIGVMIALMLPKDAAKALALDPNILPKGSEATPANELHVTLAYLGDSADMEPGQHDAALAVVQQVAAQHSPITGRVGQVGRFDANEGQDTNAVYAGFTAPGLRALRADVVRALKRAGIVLASAFPFTPHITLCYLPVDAPTPSLTVPRMSITFPALTLGWGGSYTAVSFKEAPVARTRRQQHLDGLRTIAGNLAHQHRILSHRQTIIDGHAANQYDGLTQQIPQLAQQVERAVPGHDKAADAAYMDAVQQRRMLLTGPLGHADAQADSRNADGLMPDGPASASYRPADGGFAAYYQQRKAARA